MEEAFRSWGSDSKNKLGERSSHLLPPGLAAHWATWPQNDGTQSLWDAALESFRRRILKRLALAPGVPGSHPAKALLAGRAEVMEG